LLLQEVAVLSNLAINSKVVTSDGTVVPLLGAGDKKWKASVEIVEGPEDGRILGTNEVRVLNIFNSRAFFFFTIHGLAAAFYVRNLVCKHTVIIYLPYMYHVVIPTDVSLLSLPYDFESDIYYILI